MSTRSFPRIVSLCDEGYRLDYGDMNEANARLISACPDLVAACRLALAHLDDEDCRSATHNAAVDALAKALAKAGVQP